MKKLMFLFGAIAAVSVASAKVDLGAPFSDGVILQRGMKLPVWGTANAGNKVTVSFAGQSVSTLAGADGSWRVNLEPLRESCESRVMTVEEAEIGFLFDSAVDTVEVKDVLVGEVWFASGQSNMECPIWGQSTRYRDMKGGFMTQMTKLPLVRYVKMPRKWSVTPSVFKAKWCRFTKEELLPSANGSNSYISSVAFYYVRELYLALGIPVGIVDASWGGSNIDAWTPRCAYENCDPSIKGTAEYKVKRPGEWKAEVDKKGPIWGDHQQPTVLFNGMVSAFAPMAMRGFIWYQGCTNSGEGEAQLYAAKMHALYDGWAKMFENPNLKLYFVELAPFSQNWIKLCASQEKFVDEEKNAALAVTADVGNFDDIHPNDKEIVSKRLAIHALKRDYGYDIDQDNSPRFTGVTFAEGKATLSFSDVKNWYVYAPNRSRDAAFEIAGADGVWQPAKILNYRKTKDNKTGNMVDTDFIDGSTIVIGSDKVADPVKVRYMGKSRTAGTLYNEAALPLGVFVSK